MRQERSKKKSRAHGWKLENKRKMISNKKNKEPEQKISKEKQDIDQKQQKNKKQGKKRGRQMCTEDGFIIFQLASRFLR